MFEDEFREARLRAGPREPGLVERLVGERVVHRDANPVVAAVACPVGDEPDEARTESLAASVLANRDVPEPQRVGVGSVRVERDRGHHVGVELVGVEARREWFADRWEVGVGHRGRVVARRRVCASPDDRLPGASDDELPGVTEPTVVEAERRFGLGPTEEREFESRVAEVHTPPDDGET